MRCLITGIGGSIGHHVFAHVMRETAWDVIGIDSFRHKGITDRVTDVLQEGPWGSEKRLTMITHDLTAPISPLMSNRIGPVDYIINLASLSDVFDSLQNPVPFVRQNVDVALTMLEYAREVKPLAFLQVSTDEVYGPTDGDSDHKEWEPIVPSSPYSASKAAQEAIAISYWRAYNVPLIIVNLMNNFGERQSANKFPVIVQKKVSAGEPVTIHGTPKTQGSRSYIHSTNSADAFLFLLQNTLPHLHAPGTMDKPDRYNIPGDKQLTNEGLARFIATELNAPFVVEYEDFHATRPGHDRHYGLDGTKLCALGWESPRTFEESMRDTVRWQKEHPEWLKLK